MLKQVGWPHPEAAAKAMLDYETAIAQASWSRAERRDVDKTYNPMSRPNSSPPRRSSPGSRPSLAAAPGSHRSLHRDRQHRRFEDRANLFRRAGRNTAGLGGVPCGRQRGALPVEALRRARFDFRNHELAGQPEQRPRWKRAVGFVNGVLGEAVGRIYVAEYFPPESKAKMEALVGDLQTALGARIQKREWMRTRPRPGRCRSCPS